MKAAWLKIIEGRSPLPQSMTERANMVEFADAHHVLGQMAVAWDGKVEGKLKDVLDNGLLRTGFDHRMLQFEMDRVERALAGSSIKPVLLKGGAYVAIRSKAGEGRRVSDLDILVSGNELAETEKLLRQAGWAFDSGVDNDYDLYYYRKYMHELPPLRHERRRSIIDVHHSLLPRTSRIKINTNLLRDAAIPIKGRALRVLTPVDLFIHSAVHTFADGSFDTPARSVLELHYLLQELNEAQANGLASRATEVGACMPVATALWMLADLFDDKRPSEILGATNIKPATRVVRHALKRKLENIETAAIAKMILFIRSHFLRMPLHLLAMHLARKAFRFLRKSTVQEGQQVS